jgi:hypothetical protein
LKPEQWVLTLGGLFFIGLFAAAIIPYDFWDEDVVDIKTNRALGAISQGGISTTGQGKGLTVAFGADIVPGPPIKNIVQPPQTHVVNGWDQQVCSLCHQVTRKDKGAAETITQNPLTLSAETSVTFEGAVQRLSHQKTTQGWQRVHLWIRTTESAAQEVVLSPDWFLQFLGCEITRRIVVSGDAFKKENTLYAKNIAFKSARGKSVLCRLRSENGIPLWSD